MDVGRIDHLVAEAVESLAVPNLVATIADRAGVQYVGAAGYRIAGDPGSGPVGTDSLYRIASMTKPIVTVAALHLAEAGALNLDAAVADYLPQFGRLQVITGFAEDGTPQYRPPARQATVRQLMCHTAGLAYDFFNRAQQQWQVATGTASILSGSRGILESPLHTDPGTRWEYGISTDWLGLVVEAVGGTDLEKYCQTHICGPLGMTATTFAPGAEQRAATVPVHVMDAPEHWAPSPMELPENPDFWAGGSSMYSTPADYARFTRMLLRGGELDGVRVLSEATVADAFTDQIAPLELPTTIVSLDHRVTGDFILPPGWCWGHGLALNKLDLPGMRKAFSGSWGGLFGTGFWIDPTSGITAALWSQALPGSRPEARNMSVAFEFTLYAALA